VLGITAASLVMSLALTYYLMGIASPDGEDLGIALLIATIVPLCVAPLASNLIVSLVFELQHAHEALAEVAVRDSLTQLFNRRHFMDQMQLEAGRHFRSGDPLTLMIVDADRFKNINDEFGHSTGDVVLKAIAHACEGAVRATDVLARYGGEEFAVLLPATSNIEACDVAERIRSAVTQIAIPAPDGSTINVTVSIGISTLSSPDPECKRLFDRADTALYDAKRGGRNRWVVAERVGG